MVSGKYCDPEVLLLVGGLGTRLKSVIGDNTPKALALVNGRPFLWYLLHRIGEEGFERVTLATAHLSASFQEDLQHYAPDGMEIQFSFESSPRGTGGAIVEALSVIKTDPFFAMNGDVFVKAPMKEMLAQHVASGALATLALVQVDDVARFGTVEVDDEGAVLAFKEKTGLHEKGWISAGLYVLSREALDGILDRETSSIERDVFPHLVGKGLRGFKVDSPFIDIGLPETYEAASKFLVDCGYE